MVAGSRCPGCKRQVCDGCGIYRKLNTNKQVRISFPEGFEGEPGEGLGISFDVGTTTLAGMLWDLEGGTLLDAETGSNPQAVFGADVISRIQAAAEKGENLKKMQKMLVEKLDCMAALMTGRLAKEEERSREFSETEAGDMAEAATAELGAKKKSGAGGTRSEAVKIGAVRKVVIVGNTAMSEILLGIPPLQLSRAPFIPDYEETIYLKGRELGFRFLEDAAVLILPPIGGYVGADALGVHGYVSRQEKGKRILSIDIGTNGEILLQCDGKRFACSTAAGPALEGGAISQGMRASEGAVDMVSLTGRFPMEDLTSRVIGGGAGKGICGSGLVDGLAWLYRKGVVDHTGYMREGREAKEAGVPWRIAGRIREEDGRRKFLLTEEKSPVFLTAEDVRQLQLSVSAIRSGAETLLKKAGLKAEQLDRIYLAGAFGCYIGVKSCLTIGLFPDVPEEKICQAGNLAGAGAAMALLSPETLKYMEEESRRFTHVELAGEEAFQELFLSHMNFPLKF